MLQRPVETAAFISQESTLAFTARPVRDTLSAGRKARGYPLRCLRVTLGGQGEAFFLLIRLG